jgi:integrase
MILGRGRAQTDEEIIAEYYHFLETMNHFKHPTTVQRVRAIPHSLLRYLGKPIVSWNDEDVLRMYQGYTCNRPINVFVTFLLFRGYLQLCVATLGKLSPTFSQQCRPAIEPFLQKLEVTRQQLGYATYGKSVGTMFNLLVWLLVVAHKPLNELTRADFEAFRDEYKAWYPHDKPHFDGEYDYRLYRLEQYLVHWKVIPPAQKVFRHEERFAQIRPGPIREAILLYMTFCQAKLNPSTIDNRRTHILAFFLWFQQHYPTSNHLEDVSREVALAYAGYLKSREQEGHCTQNYRRDLYTSIRLFFAFVVDERLEAAPLRNPFSVKDTPQKPDMLPRYLSDQELRIVLSYCEKEATQIERTIVITLLHTGIRAAELAALKTSDLVQIAGVWKLHIHQGKGLKDRVIPLTPQCLAVLQTWLASGWERANEFLFTFHGRPWKRSVAVSRIIREMGVKINLRGITHHRFRHTFAVSLLNYGVRESALQKLMGHKTLDMTLEYGRILDQTVEKAFTEAVEQMQEGPLSWVPSFFTQQEYTLFAEGDSVSWIRLPVGFCRRNPRISLGYVRCMNGSCHLGFRSKQMW